MARTIRNRITELETRVGVQDERCPKCGASHSVYMAIESNAMIPRCMVCGVEREAPTTPVKAYPRELMEAWPR